MSEKPPYYGKRLRLEIPAYDGRIDVKAALALMELAELLKANGVDLTTEARIGDSCISRVRSQIAGSFLFTGEDYLLMMDSDQPFRPQVVLDLLAADKDIVSAAIPPRMPVAVAPLSRYSKMARPMVPRLRDGKANRDGKLLELEFTGAGMLLIKRRVMLALRERHPELWFAEYFAVFLPVAGHGIWMAEDSSFCIRARLAGFEVWTLLTDAVDHVGRCIWLGSETDAEQSAEAAIADRQAKPERFSERDRAMRLLFDARDTSADA